MSLNLNAVIKIGESKDKRNALVLFKKDVSLFTEHLFDILEDSDLRENVLSSNSADSINDFLKFCYNNIITTSEYAVYDNLLRAMKNDQRVIDSVYTQVTGLFNLSGLTKKACSKASYVFGSSDWLDNFSDLQQCNSEKLSFLAQTGRVDNPQADFYLRYADLEAPRIVSNVYTWLMDVEMDNATKTARVNKDNGIELTARYLTLETIEGKFVFVASVFPEEELQGESPERTRLIYDHKKSSTYRMPMTANDCDTYWNSTTTYQFARMFTDMHQIGFILANSKAVNGVLTSAKAIKNGASNFASGAIGALKNIGFIKDNAYASALRNSIAIIVNAYGKKNLHTILKGGFMYDYNRLFDRQHPAKGALLEEFISQYLPLIADLVEEDGKMEELIPVACYENIEGDFLIRNTRNDAPFTKTVSYKEGMELRFFNLVDESFEVEKAIDIEEISESTENKEGVDKLVESNEKTVEADVIEEDNKVTTPEEELVPSTDSNGKTVEVTIPKNDVKNVVTSSEDDLLDIPQDSTSGSIKAENLDMDIILDALVNNILTVISFAEKEGIKHSCSTLKIADACRTSDINKIMRMYNYSYDSLSERVREELLLTRRVQSNVPMIDMVTGKTINPNESVQIWHLLHEDLVDVILLRKEYMSIQIAPRMRSYISMYKYVHDTRDKGKFGETYDKAADILMKAEKDEKVLYIIENFYYAKYYHRETSKLVMSDKKYAEFYLRKIKRCNRYFVDNNSLNVVEKVYREQICKILDMLPDVICTRLMLDVATKLAIEKTPKEDYTSIKEYIPPQYMEEWQKKFESTEECSVLDKVITEAERKSAEGQSTDSDGEQPTESTEEEVITNKVEISEEDTDNIYG